MSKLNTEQIWLETSLLTNSLLMPLMPLNTTVGKKWLNEIYSHIKDAWVEEFGTQPKPSEVEDELLNVLIHARSGQSAGFSEEKIDSRMVEIVNMYPRLQKSLQRAAKKIDDPKMLFAQIAETTYFSQLKHLVNLVG